MNKGDRLLKTKRNFINSIPLFTLMLGFWIFLSGKFDLFHLLAGVICSILVTVFSRKLHLANPPDRGGIALELYRLLKYSLWLVYQIFISGIDVTKRVFKLDMPINPGIIKTKSMLKSDVALTVLANSITLTPGTMTIDIVDEEIYIHCLAIESEEALLKSEAEFELQIMKMLGYKNVGVSK